MITGKPLELGGSQGRAAATGRGVMTTAMCAMEKMGLDPKKATCAVQGFGNVGSWGAKLLAEKGVTIVAISIVKETINQIRSIADLIASRNRQP